METSDEIGQLKIVGGNLALDLLNTRDAGAGDSWQNDVLRDYADVLAWARRVGLLDDAEVERLRREARRHPDTARAVFERTTATRDSLYEIFTAVAAGRHASEDAIAELRRDEAEALTHARLIPVDGGYAWSWTTGARDGDLGRLLWPIIHAALTLLVDGPLDRVKGCPTCSYVFLDESKNRSRRWCSMDDCGTDDKMRKYVARRASARAAARHG